MNFPIGIYSKKYKSWAELPERRHASPSRTTRPTAAASLLLLQDKGVIKLKAGVGFKPTIADITDNPKKLKIVEIDAAQTPRALDDVDAAAVNTNYATQAGLDPVRKELIHPARGSQGPLRQPDRGARRRQGQAMGQDLVDSYHTPEVRAFVLTKFKGAVLPAW